MSARAARRGGDSWASTLLSRGTAGGCDDGSESGPACMRMALRMRINASLDENFCAWHQRRREFAMEHNEVINKLNEGRHIWEPFGVTALYVFGSVARGEARADSDVDVLVDFKTPISLFEFVRLRRALEELLGHPVDLVTRSALKPEMRDSILREAVRAA